MKYKLNNKFQIDYFEDSIIITHKIDDKIDMSKALVFEDVSKFIIESILKNLTKEVIIKNIIKEYDVSKDKADEDFNKFIEELIKIGVIKYDEW